MSATDRNLDVFSKPEVVEYYTAATGLQKCEAYAFDKYILRGDAILDIGVGGGRTTPHLSDKAGRYVGADYSRAMVEACRKQFPTLEFHCEDATDLRKFADAIFAVVVFSFNGIDYIRSDEQRLLCLREVCRILKPGGFFIFSSHNAKALGVWPVFDKANALQIAWRLVRALGKSVALTGTTLTAASFHNGSGYIMDPVHGGLASLVSTPESIGREARAAGFEFMEAISGLFPLRMPKFLIPWYYYVLVKS